MFYCCLGWNRDDLICFCYNRDDNEDALDIKPPQANPPKKDKHKHKHKDERKRDRDKDRSRDRHGDRDRERGKIAV